MVASALLVVNKLPSSILLNSSCWPPKVPVLDRGQESGPAGPIFFHLSQCISVSPPALLFWGEAED